MSISDDVYDMEYILEEHFGEDSKEVKLFSHITDVMFAWEDELDEAEKKLRVIEEFKQLLTEAK